MTNSVRASARGHGEGAAASPAVEPRYLAGIRKSISEVLCDARGWTESWAAPVAVIDAPNGFGEETWSVALDVSLIAWHRRGATVVCEVPGFRGRATDCADRKINLQHAGVAARYRADGAVGFSHFYLRPAIIERVAADLGRTPALRDDLIMQSDAELWLLLDAYARRSGAAHDPPSRLEMELRALLIVERLFSKHHGVREPTIRGGLAAWQLKRTCEAMLDSLETRTGLDELAAVAGCSPTHFSRAFKQSMGVSPFRWLDAQRIERAKQLLEDGRAPLAEVALAVGYAAQPQFTTAFTRATGITPARWRRERRG